MPPPRLTVISLWHKPVPSTFLLSVTKYPKTLFSPVRITCTMASALLPTILLVPGAFGTPDGYEKLVPYLQEAGFTTHPGPYPSCDPVDPSTATSEKDIISLREHVILPLLDDKHNDIVIVAHSYGGVVGGGAAKGLDKATRMAQGKTSAVAGLIYVAGNITLEGESLSDAVGGEYPPFIKRDQVRAAKRLSLSLSPRVQADEETRCSYPIGLTKIIQMGTNADAKLRSTAFQGPCPDRTGERCPL